MVTQHVVLPVSGILVVSFGPATNGFAMIALADVGGEQFLAYVFGNLFDFPGYPRLQPEFPLQRRLQRKQEIAGGRRLD